MISFNTIYNEDCLITLNRMDDGLLDLTITSPPYNVDHGYDQYVDNKPYFEYIDWLKSIFALIYQKTKKGGRCVINIGDQKNGAIPLHSDVIQVMTSIGWLPYTTIVWNKNTCNGRTAWGSWLSPSMPSFPRPFEFILVFSKESMKLITPGETDLERQDFIKWSLGLWSIQPETRKLKHPAPFPEELPLRCMKMLSYKNSIVYDPFIGSGTTALVALKNNRRYIGSEISSEYCGIAENRIAQYTTTYKEKDFF